MDSADGIEEIGKGTGGWSNVGLAMADSFKQDIDDAMSNMTAQMTDAIDQIIAVQEMIDLAIGQMGDEASSLLQIKADPTDDEDAFPVPLPDALKAPAAAAIAAMDDPDNQAAMKAALTVLAPKVMKQIGEGLDSLLDITTPGLIKIGQWEESFGDKLQAGVEQFSTTIDVVQKLFDQVMLQLNPPSDNPELFQYMMQQTFAMFALTNATAGIMVQDLQDVAEIYGVSALQGSKSEQMFQKFDANKDAYIDTVEFAGFANDPSVPFITAVVLRQYSKGLAEVAGKLKQAKMRDEVAGLVCNYLQLVCAKNITKVGWIADMLTNDTLPQAFTADIMRNLALMKDDPNVLTTADVGALVIGTMAELNPEATTAAAELMGNTSFWADEGFDPADQPVCVDRVSAWTSASLLETGSKRHIDSLHKFYRNIGGENKSLALLQSDTWGGVGQSAESKAAVAAEFGHMGRALAEKNRRHYFQLQAEFRKERYEMLHATSHQRHLFDTLLGGKMANTFDPAAIMATKSGVPAKPETLLFAQWLSYNASDCASEFQENSFNYTGQSSSAMDSFATQIQGMVKKTQSLLAMLADYSGPDGVDNLREKISQFVEMGTDELLAAITSMGKNSSGNSSGNSSDADNASSLLAIQQPEGGVEPGGTEWMQMVAVLDQLVAVLPQVVSNLKLARNAVSAVSATLDSVFDTFADFGYPLFAQIAATYRMIWTAWFVLLSIFTLGILYYGFWASGWCGGPKAKEIRVYRKASGVEGEEDYDPGEEEEEREALEEAEKTCFASWCGCESWTRWLKTIACCRRASEEPNTFFDKCKCVCGSCCAWMCDCCETECCFWSLILMGQLFVFVMFLISLVLVIIAGVLMFISSGCASVYILGDDKVCFEQLKMLQSWISTFDAGAPDLPLDQVCASKSLVVCGIIEEKMQTGAIMSVAGAVVAAVLTFQLLIESSILHERARMRKLIDAGLRDGTLVEKEEEEEKEAEADKPADAEAA